MTALLQVAVLPRDCLDPDGNPNLKGWGYLKHVRKKGMFMSIIGGPPLPRHVPVLLPTVWPADPRQNLSLPGAQRAPTALDYAGVLDEVHLAETEAELAERRAAAPEHQSVGFGGKLGTADDIAEIFQMASAGNLVARQGRQTQKSYGPYYTNTPEELLSYPGTNLAKLGNPGRLPQGDRAGPSGHPPAEGGISGEGGSVEDLRPRCAKRARIADGGSNVSWESEESLHVTWPAWAGRRCQHRQYAVTALDAAKVEQLMGYWHERGYLRKPIATREAAEAACVVSAAHRKGQGVLLTVQETDPDEYEKRSKEREQKYYQKYGKRPVRDGWGPDEDPDDAAHANLWREIRRDLW